MKIFVIIVSVSSLISSVYGEHGEVNGEFWWENNNTDSQPRAQDGITITTTTVSNNTTQGEASCTCVPWYLCNNGTVNTDGAGIIDIRTTCPVTTGDQREVCCGSQPSSPPSVTPPTPPVDHTDVWCECVPQRLCNNGIINTDGAGVIDFRIRKNITANVKFCPENGGEAEVCCGLPPSENTTEKITTISSTSSTVNSTEYIISSSKVTIGPTEDMTSTSKVTIGPTVSPPESQGGDPNSASYFTSILLLQVILVITPFFVTLQLL